jgi:hypothetical protein
MYKFLVVIFLFILCKVSFAQNSFVLTPSDFDVINFAIKDKRTGIKLVSEMTEYDLKQIKKYVVRGVFLNRKVDENKVEISDSILLTKNDKKQILKNLKSLRKFKWTEEVVSNIKFDKLGLISYDSSISKNFFYSIRYNIVPPLYFQNNKYCILSFSYSCGQLCGHGQITIYKKTDVGWIRWNHLTWWDE